jgi:hypothetical protein
MDKSKVESVYLDLVIEAASENTDIWLGDDDGHFVQKGVGVLRSSLMPGNYTVEFGLGSTTYPISLTETSRLTEADLVRGPTCPRPVPRLHQDIE